MSYSELGLSPEEVIETLGPCTNDIRDCEIMRAAIVLKGTYSELSRAIGTMVCDECKNGESLYNN